MIGVREVLRDLHDQHHYLTPRMVLNVARDPQHPLHGQFEWDDRVAGERYRIEQARVLIRSFRITYRDDMNERHEVRSYVSTLSETGPVYRATEEVVSDDVARAVLLRALERDLNLLHRKYGHLEEFAAIVREHRWPEAS